MTNHTNKTRDSKNNGFRLLPGFALRLSSHSYAVLHLRDHRYAGMNPPLFFLEFFSGRSLPNSIVLINALLNEMTYLEKYQI